MMPSLLRVRRICADVLALIGMLSILMTLLIAAAAVPAFADTVTPVAPFTKQTVCRSDPQPHPDLTSLTLGAAGSFLVLSQGALVNVGRSIVSGDIGTGKGSALSGFGRGTTAKVGGTIHQGDDVAVAALKGAQLAYTTAQNLAPAVSLDAQDDLAGLTLCPGVYSHTTAATRNGVLTLDGLDDPAATFVIQIGTATTPAALTIAAGSILLINGAKPQNVYWEVTGAVTIAAATSFAGNVLAAGAITIGAGDALAGTIVAQGAITLDSNTCTFTPVSPPSLNLNGGERNTDPSNAPTITGTVQTAFPTSAVTVTVSMNTQTITVVVPAGTDASKLDPRPWSVLMPNIPTGTYRLDASVSDQNGNRASATQAFSVGANNGLVPLGTAANYTIFGGGGITGDPTTTIAGNVGTSPSAMLVNISSAPGGGINGVSDLNNAAAQKAAVDMDLAYTDAEGRIASSDHQFSGDLTGHTFVPGVYHDAGAFANTGTVTFDALGNPDAVFIFQIDAAMNTAAGSKMVLAGGALASHVFWQVNGALSTGASGATTPSTLVGTFLVFGAATIGAGSTLNGRILATGAVTLAGNWIYLPPADTPPAGSLTITAPAAVDFGAYTPTVGDQIIHGDLGTVTVTDTRTGAAVVGWTSSVTCADFGYTRQAADTPRTPEPAALNCGTFGYSSSQLTHHGAGTATGSAPTAIGKGVVTVTDGGTAGANSTSWKAGLAMSIPANTPTGTYTGTITHSVL